MTTSVPFVRRAASTRADRSRRRAFAPRPAPLIPQPGKAGTAGYWWYLAPGLILVTAVIVIPVIWNIYLTFTSWRGIKPPQWIGLANWEHLLHDAKFWTSFSNSIWMIVAMVIVPTAIGLVIAAALFDVVGRKFGPATASLLRAAYYLPQILPVVIAGIVIGWIARPRDGAFNTLLDSIGLSGLAHNWLGDPNTALGTMMVVLVWAQIGYPVVIFMAALQRVDPQLYEAAELDGANWFQRFRSITIGTITPEIFVVTLTCTIAALKVFGPIYVLTRGGPDTSTIVPSYYSYSQFFQAQQVGYGATIATALTFVIAIVAIVFVKAQTALEAREQAGR